MPARNEAEVLPISLSSLLKQDYKGEFQVILIDDQSTDETSKIAQEVAQKYCQIQRIKILLGKPLPSEWTGKLWAVEQGIFQANQQLSPPDYFLLTDADIEHSQDNLSQLVTKAEQENLALVSLMVLLRCKSFWEKLLIPAFIFFFQKLYPFPLVNNSNKKTAAAAGGCILIRRDILEKIGGIKILHKALIDDCSLAIAVKSYLQKENTSYHSIWLGLTQSTYSLRPYPTLETIWNMVARTAFTQLNYSPWLLIGTMIGLFLTYLTSPIAIIMGLLLKNWFIFGVGLITWLLMAIAYLPTLKLYKLSFLWAFSLPIIAFLYSLMTIDSALRHWQGKGGNWKGRTY